MKAKFLLPFVLALLFVSCGDEPNDVDYDYSPMGVYLFVTDADGNDLLNPETAGNILGNEITIKYRNEVYPLHLESKNPVLCSPLQKAPRRKYYLAMLYGAYLEKIERTGEYYICFGEIAGEERLDMEEVIVEWGDGTSDKITLYNLLEWKKKKPFFTRKSWLNDVLCYEGDAPGFVFNIIKD
ncbi:MAG: hypothetical protein J6X81_03565 [Muribaculaceae bacterium]|nr:hypothetical protein [Muribaculaceae bacterium]